MPKSPPQQTENRNQLAELASAYSDGAITWAEISEKTGASYGELLIELGLKELKIPQVKSAKTPGQIEFLNQVLDTAASNSKSEK